MVARAIQTLDDLTRRAWSIVGTKALNDPVATWRYTLSPLEAGVLTAMRREITQDVLFARLAA